MLDKQFKIFSFILLLFMIICYLYSDNNSMFFRGGNLDTVLSEKKLVLKQAETAANKAQMDFNSLGDDSPDPNNYGEALNTALTAKNLAQTDVDIAGQNINKCLIDLKEVYNASDILKDLKERITSCGDNVLFTNPLEADIKLSETEDKIAAANALIEADRVEAKRIADRAIADQLATKNAEEAEKLAEAAAAAAAVAAAVSTPSATVATPVATPVATVATDSTPVATPVATVATDSTTVATVAPLVATPVATVATVATPVAPDSTPVATVATDSTTVATVATPASGTTGGQYDISGFSHRQQYAPV